MKIYFSGHTERGWPEHPKAAECFPRMFSYYYAKTRKAVMDELRTFAALNRDIYMQVYFSGVMAGSTVVTEREREEVRADILQRVPRRRNDNQQTPPDRVSGNAEGIIPPEERKKMKIYYSGNAEQSWTLHPAAVSCYPRMFSYYYSVVRNDVEREMRWRLDHNQGVFLDSGAFTAKTQGTEIKLQEYIDFLNTPEWAGKIEHYANLDDLTSAQVSWDNLKEMERQGLTPMAVYHMGEDPKWLKKYLAEYEWLALGGMVGTRSADLSKWLDEILPRYILDPKTQKPRVKLHGFGVTSMSLLLRYPWTTADSSSWLKTAALGSVLIPVYRAGSPVYNELPRAVYFPETMKKSPEHFDNILPSRREETERWLTEHNSSLEAVADYRERRRLAVAYFKHLEQAVKDAPKIVRTAGGFGL